MTYPQGECSYRRAEEEEDIHRARSQYPVREIFCKTLSRGSRVTYETNLLKGERHRRGSTFEIPV